MCCLKKMNKEYVFRRKQMIKKMVPKSAFIIFSAEEKIRNADNKYKYRQDSNFFYLTGFNEPKSLLILVKQIKYNKCILFNQNTNELKKIWGENNIGQESAIKLLKIDYSYSWNNINNKLYLILNNLDTIYYQFGINDKNDKLLFMAINILRKKKIINKNFSPPNNFSDLIPVLQKIRLIKSKEEICKIKHACFVTKLAHIRAIKYCKPEKYEYELAAEIQHEFLINGNLDNSYNIIVGSGINTCILHYIENKRKMKSGELVLIDAGCEYKNYASDVTRTIPVNGKFSKEQLVIYNVVLEMLNLFIKLCKPKSKIKNIKNKVIHLLVKRLKHIGLLSGNIKDLIYQKSYKKYFMHKLFHFIGLDVHDTSDYLINNKNFYLKSGMTIAIEPGIYIPINKKIKSPYQGIGIRIEDNILITKKGNINLTKDIVRKSIEIENLMKKNK
ncbi:pepP [Wigglesworthia glossinidia endosymbiont of Glossina brevipalpis]|uniref:Xaa-Pro aminopeptidase n=1 Tax=Wigglesworthia glossinidia brevipalpis TaxID=36870 RepID=Q8D2C2_WIGBR|nr:pepP [Wigglesworthia glossinidia endosymbiont of Glossina brevipalpis]